MRKAGVLRRPDGWVVVRVEDVAAALTSSKLSVSPPFAASGAAARLQARMARFSDDENHSHARTHLAAVLPEVRGLREASHRRTLALLPTAAATMDAMALARTVPVSVLGEALGIGAGDITRAVTLTGRLCRALAAGLSTLTSTGAGDRTASELLDLLRATRTRSDGDDIVAAVSVLVQAYDATAAFIGAAVLVHSQRVDAGIGVETTLERTLRQDAPVQCTRRWATDNVELGGIIVPAGAVVWIFLAAAEEGAPKRPSTFGAGPHSCPGSAQATAIARGMLTALVEAGWTAVPGQVVTYESRPNLRMPMQVLVEKR